MPPRGLDVELGVGACRSAGALAGIQQSKNSHSDRKHFNLEGLYRITFNLGPYPY